MEQYAKEENFKACVDKAKKFDSDQVLASFVSACETIFVTEDKRTKIAVHMLLNSVLQKYTEFQLKLQMRSKKKSQKLSQPSFSTAVNASASPSSLIQKECFQYIKEGNYQKSIEVYRRALADKEDPPFCHVRSLIEDTLIKIKAITKVKVDASDNLTSKSRKILYELSDDRLEEAFSLIHEFVKDGKRFSVNDFNRYLESRIKLRPNKRKLKQGLNSKQKRITTFDHYNDKKE